MSKANILAADDARVMRTIITRKLEEQGYAVTAVEEGKRALELIESEPFDLVILDIHMPGLNGVETLQQLRQKFSAIELPIIMATAKDDNEEVVRAFELGANDFVSKPINFPVLLARIETHLRLKRATEELERLAGSGGSEAS